jgi:hypothetical protein
MVGDDLGLVVPGAEELRSVFEPRFSPVLGRVRGIV